MNEPKQLECQLKCKAKGSLEESVAEDLCKKDKCLAKLIQEEENAPEDKNDDSRDS